MSSHTGVVCTFKNGPFLAHPIHCSALHKMRATANSTLINEARWERNKKHSDGLWAANRSAANSVHGLKRQILFYAWNASAYSNRNVFGSFFLPVPVNVYIPRDAISHILSVLLSGGISVELATNLFGVSSVVQLLLRKGDEGISRWIGLDWSQYKRTHTQ